jgi:alpha-glucosidase
MLLTLRGSPFFYYGEEIGMVTTDPQTLEDVRDPVGKRYWPGNKGRDGVRTPMQWDAGLNAGFTTGTPWLKVPPSGARKNVAAEIADPLSLLNFYKQAIALRHHSPALLDGDYQSVGNDPHIFAYLRRGPRQTMLIALNMSLEARKLQLDQSTLGGAGAHLRMVLSNWRVGAQAVDAHPLYLAPLEAAVMEVITK